jgi:hypothetical protein
MAPKRFNKFTFAPTEGASGGIFVGWNGSIFDGAILSIYRFAITVKFTSIHNAEEWTLTTVYGPCHGPERQEFVSWLNSLNVDDDPNWMFVGDFNFYRSFQDRNRDGCNMQDIMVFNEIISNLGLQEIPLKGRSFTWSNMQQNPLLEQLEWCFTSINWTSDYPNTLMLPLSRTTSDHTPCKIQIGTAIPKAKIFRFENFWVEQPGFLETVQSVWQSKVKASNSATRVVAKFKQLKRVLKKLALGLSKIQNLIKQCDAVLAALDKLEENRVLNPVFFF